MMHPFLIAAKAYPSNCAVVDGDRRYSYAEIADDACRVASNLRGHLSPGSRIAIYMKNRVEYIVLQIALELAGLVRVPISRHFTASQMRAIVEDASASALFFDNTTKDRVFASSIGDIWLCSVDDGSAQFKEWSELVLNSSECANFQIECDQLSSISYTSGSSGSPKGVMLDNRRWFAIWKNMLIDRDFRHGDCVGHIGPLSHASGTYLMPTFIRGGTNVLIPDGSVQSLPEVIEKEKVNIFTSVPSMLTRLLDLPELFKYDMTSLRWIGYGAEPIQANTLKKAIEYFGPILVQNYGQTEAMMTCTFLSAANHLHDDGDIDHIRFGCIGKPYSFVDIELYGDNGLPVKNGEVGEITIAAEHVMIGYWNNETATSIAMKGGRLWTGDLARRDRDGFYYIVGRNRDFIISGGYNVYFSEVEQVLSSYHGISEVAVVPIADQRFGESLMAFIVSNTDDFSLTGLEAFSRNQLGVKKPTRWSVIEVMPRTGNGKIDRNVLKSYANDGEDE